MRTHKDGNGESLGALPRNWERAFGYDGEARHVAFYWTPAGDGVLYDDDQASGDGNRRLFLTLRHQHPGLDQRYNIGNSDVEADHWLLLYRETRDLVVLPRAEAQLRLHHQWPPFDLDIGLTPLDWEIIHEAVQQAVDNVQAGMEQIQPCDTCFYSIAPGWLQTAGGGLDPCPVCNGWGFLPRLEEQGSPTSQVRSQLFLFRFECVQAFLESAYLDRVGSGSANELCQFLAKAFQRCSPVACRLAGELLGLSGQWFPHVSERKGDEDVTGQGSVTSS